MPIPVFTMPILAFTFRRSGCSRCSDPCVHDGPKSAMTVKIHQVQFAPPGSHAKDGDEAFVPGERTALGKHLSIPCRGAVYALGRRVRQQCLEGLN
jgi:hypothetical protein